MRKNIIIGIVLLASSTVVFGNEITNSNSIETTTKKAQNSPNGLYPYIGGTIAAIKENHELSYEASDRFANFLHTKPSTNLNKKAFKYAPGICAGTDVVYNNFLIGICAEYLLSKNNNDNHSKLSDTSDITVTSASTFNFNCFCNLTTKTGNKLSILAKFGYIFQNGFTPYIVAGIQSCKYESSFHGELVDNAGSVTCADFNLSKRKHSFVFGIGLKKELSNSLSVDMAFLINPLRNENFDI